MLNRCYEQEEKLVIGDDIVIPGILSSTHIETGQGVFLMVQWLGWCDFTMSGLLVVRKLRFCKPCEDKKKKKPLKKQNKTKQNSKKETEQVSLFLLTGGMESRTSGPTFNFLMSLLRMNLFTLLFCLKKREKNPVTLRNEGKYSFQVVFSFCRYCFQSLPICFFVFRSKT